jgi:hypothetical protein
VGRALKRLGITRKKTLCAVERDSPVVQAKCAAFLERLQTMSVEIRLGGSLVEER